jgi:glycosyltransferase involved in cell wall biosynthesis
MINIIYLIPLDSLGGGVEVAAKGVKSITHNRFNFDVKYICKEKSELFNPKVFIQTAKSIYKIKPDVIILSLWRAQLVGLFLKLLMPQIKIIFFVHSAKDAHLLDYLLSRLILILSTEIWGDSITSLKERFRHSSKKIRIGRVVDFNARNINKLKQKKVSPDFIFWGRVGREKGVDRAVTIFSKIHKYYPEATFKIIGSDGGTLNQIKVLCKSLQINKSITFHDEMDFLEIKNFAKNASFYLQTSLYEGAAMSVMESMKLGLIPVVTPVGEISRYCNSDNSIIVRSNNEAVRDIMMLLESNERYLFLSRNASLKFNFQLSYTESIIKNTEEMIKKWF